MKAPLFYVWLALLIFVGCSLGARQMQTSSLVAEWNGREIVFPESLSSLQMAKDLVCHKNLDNIPYK